MDSSNTSSPATPRFARCSGPEYGRSGYPCQHPWPENCFVQSGARGVVFKQEGAYHTAFFEAFPRDPNAFLRGEGSSVQEAEDNCWKKYQSILNCPGHSFDRRSRRDGYAFCKHCALSGMFLEPLERCHICNVPAHYGQDSNGNWYCEKDYEEIPPELWSETRKRFERFAKEENEQEDMTAEEFAAAFLGAHAAIKVITEQAVRGERKVEGICDLADQAQSLLKGEKGEKEEKEEKEEKGED